MVSSHKRSLERIPFQSCSGVNLIRPGGHKSTTNETNKWHNYIAHYSTVAGYRNSMQPHCFCFRHLLVNFEIPNRKEKGSQPDIFGRSGLRSCETMQKLPPTEQKPSSDDELWLLSVRLSFWPFGNRQCWGQLPFVCQMAKI